MYRSRIIGPLYRYFWRFKLTPAGRGTVGAFLLAAVGSITVEIPIYQLACGLLALLFVTEPLGLLFRPSVDLQGRLPERARGRRVVHRDRYGHQFHSNAGLRFDARHVRIAAGSEDPQRRSVRPNVTPRRIRAVSRDAGRLAPGHLSTSPIHAHSTFPFNLMRFGGSKLPEQTVTVLPAYRSVARIEIPHSQRYQPGGVLMSANVGQSMEYVGNREYVAGEPARRLDFRAWARLGRPVVREYQEEYSCRIALILDTHVPNRLRPGFHGGETLEAGVSLTAAAAEAMSTGDVLIDLFAAGPSLHVLRTDGSRASFDAVLEILASVGPSRPDPFLELSSVVDQELQNVSTAVCVLLDWDEPRRQLAERILEAGCALKIMIVRESPTTLAADAADTHVTQYTPQQVREGTIREL